MGTKICTTDRCNSATMSYANKIVTLIAVFVSLLIRMYHFGNNFYVYYILDIHFRDQWEERLEFICISFLFS